MTRETQALFALVRAGLWERFDEAMASVFPLSEEGWERVFEMARQQTVTGIAFRGLDYLPEDYSPSVGILIRWAAYAGRIEQSNGVVNHVLKVLYAHFSDAGVRAVLQKGPGVAMMYPEPLLRECGDIDVFFPELDDRTDPMRNLPDAEGEKKPDGCWEYQVNGVIIERHSSLLDIHRPLVRRRMRRFIAEKGYDKVDMEGCTVEVPSPEVNMLLLSSHILKHAIGVGIGLRQLCDMAMAYRYYSDRIDPHAMNEVYAKAGLRKWSGLLESFLVEYLGLAPDMVTNDEIRAGRTKKTRILLDIILKGGNFGRFTDKRERALENVRSRKWHTFASFIGNVRFAVVYAPGEWLWTMLRLAGGQVR